MTAKKNTKTTKTPAKAETITLSAAETKALQVARDLTAKAAIAGRQATIQQVDAWLASKPFVGNPLGWKTGADYARDLGIAKSSLVRIQRLGVAKTLGVNPENTESGDADVWSIVSSLYAKPVLVDALTDEKATATKVRRAAKRADADRAAGRTTPRKGASKTTGEGEADSKGPVMPRNNSGLIDLIETVRARWDMSATTPAEHKRLAEVLRTFDDIEPTVTKAQAKRRA